MVRSIILLHESEEKNNVTACALPFIVSLGQNVHMALSASQQRLTTIQGRCTALLNEAHQRVSFDKELSGTLARVSLKGCLRVKAMLQVQRFP